MRSKRVLAALAIPVLLFGNVSAASAATIVNGGISSLGSGYAINNQTTGWLDPNILDCDVGAESLQTGDVAYARCTLEYDISNVPAGATIISAKLNIYTPLNGNCAGNACSMVVGGYVGNAAFSLGDLTAGSQVGQDVMGNGTTVTFDVKTFVKSVLAGPDFPVAGFNLARGTQNPADDRVTVGHPGSAHPPTLVITYAIPTAVTVAVAPAGTGTVGAEGSAINCPGTCTATYLPGAPVKLHADPANGFAFSQWVGAACAGQGNVCSFTMPSTAVSVTAAFLSTAPPPTGAPTQPAKTRAPGITAAPGEPTAAPATDAPSDPIASAVVATVAPTRPAPTILGLDDPNAQPASDGGGLPGILIFIVIAVLIAVGIGLGVYRFAATRAPKA